MLGVPAVLRVRDSLRLQACCLMLIPPASYVRSWSSHTLFTHEGLRQCHMQQMQHQGLWMQATGRTCMQRIVAHRTSPSTAVPLLVDASLGSL